MGKWRSYTDQEKANAVGLALAIGAKKAAAELGFPRRTISSWMHAPTPGVQAAIVRSRDDVASRLWEAVTAGTDAVLTGLRDPKARLGDKASALRIVVEAHALISGGATSRTETTNGINRMTELDWEQAHRLAQAIDEIGRLTDLDDEALQAWLLKGQNGEASGLVQLRELQQRAEALEAADDVG